jgi:2-dehydro-3-deoxyphosphogluconate aldolase/(4S)-4-hydroxy-2-oxoglutarate aldolase
MKEFHEAFSSNPIIGVIRDIDKKKVVSSIEAAVDGGLTTVEITMNTADADDLINLTSAYFGGKCVIGAGTVLTIENCRKAIDSGASFIVTPVTDPDVIKFCKSEGIPVIAGALTPSEVFASWNYGATMVKVFPAGLVGGPDYISELRGPFKDIPLVAFSGISPEKVDDYFKAGVNGIGLGKRLFRSDWIEDNHFDKVKECAETFTKAVKKQIGTVQINKADIAV